MPDERDHPLELEQLDRDPVRQLGSWLDEARAAGIELAETAALATATADGAPSVRMVLVKDIGEDGLVFFTGYDSRKGNELAENPRAALVFYWQSSAGRRAPRGRSAPRSPTRISTPVPSARGCRPPSRRRAR